MRAAAGVNIGRARLLPSGGGVGFAVRGTASAGPRGTHFRGAKGDYDHHCVLVVVRDARSRSGRRL